MLVHVLGILVQLATNVRPLPIEELPPDPTAFVVERPLFEVAQEWTLVAAGLALAWLLFALGRHVWNEPNNPPSEKETK